MSEGSASRPARSTIDSDKPDGEFGLPATWTWATLGECFDVHVGATPSRVSTTELAVDPELQQAMAFAATRMDRLGQVKEWLSEDPELLSGIVGTIKKKDVAAQRRRALLSVFAAILSLPVGWLLSGLNPTFILSQFVGH